MRRTPKVLLTVMCVLCLVLGLAWCFTRGGSGRSDEGLPLVTDQVGTRQLVVWARLKTSYEGSKYIWEDATVIHIVYNGSGAKVGRTLLVAHRSSESGLPKQKSLLRLVPFDTADPPERWLLVQVISSPTEDGAGKGDEPDY